jgi:hypothetical protein
LILLYKGKWQEISERLVATVKEIGFGCVYTSFSWYRYSKDFRLKDDSLWTLNFSVIKGKEDYVDDIVEVLVKVGLYKIKPTELHFFVAFHPWVIRGEKSAGAIDLIRSVLIRLMHMSEDVNQLGGWINMMNDNWVLVCHDNEDLKRVEFVLGHSRMPYNFVVTYNVNSPLVSIDYRVATKGRSYFDALAEAILEEYWSEMRGGGER